MIDKKNQRKKKLDSHYDLYKDAFKEMNSQKNNWNWVNSLKSQYKKPSKGEIGIYLKRIKRTQPFQIGYKVEDLDEDIRRLEKIVEITKRENIDLENEMKSKENYLRGLEAKFENAENFMFDLGDVKYSMNLMRNLERDYCLLKKKIRDLKLEIFGLKNSEKYFEFMENKTIVKYYKNEIDKFDLLAKEIVKKNKFDFKDFLKKNKEKIRKREIRLKKYCNELEIVENDIFGIESKKFNKKKNFPNLKSLIKKNKKYLKTKRLLKNKIKNEEQRIDKLKKHKNSPEFIKSLNFEKFLTFEINKKNKTFFEYIIIYLSIYKLNQNYISEMTEEMNNLELEKRKNIFMDFFDLKKKYFKKEFFEFLKKINLESLLDNLIIYKNRYFEDKEVRGDFEIFQMGIDSLKIVFENDNLGDNKNPYAVDCANDTKSDMQNMIKIDLFLFVENFPNICEILKFFNLIINFEKIKNEDVKQMLKILKDYRIDKISFDFLDNCFVINKIKKFSKKNKEKDKSFSSLSSFEKKSNHSKIKNSEIKKHLSKSKKKKNHESFTSNEDFFEDDKNQKNNSKRNVENHLNELIDDMNKFEEKNNYSDFFGKSFSEKSETNLSFT